MANVLKSLFGGNKKAERVSEPYEQDGKKQEIISYMKNEYERRMRLRKPFELQWLENINFYEGNQYIAKETKSGQLYETAPVFYYEERQVYNQIAPIIETRLAKLSRMKNLLKTRTPANADADSAKKATLGNKILAGTQEMIEFTRKQERANNWMEITGTGIYKTFWDSSKGNIIGIQSENKIYDEEDLESFEEELADEGKLPLTRYIREGFPNSVVVSPFEIFPENPYKPYEKNNSIMHVKVVTIDELYEKYGVIDKGTSHNVLSLSHSMFPVGNVGNKSYSYNIHRDLRDDTVILYELFELPTRRHPAGRWIICTDNKLVHYQEQLPDYLKGEGNYFLPFDLQKSINKLDYFFGDSIISRLIPLQRSYNTIKNRKREYINRVAIGVLVAPANSLQDDEDLEEEGIAPGRIIYYTPGVDKPHFLEISNFPNGLENEESKLLEDFARLSGVSELSKQSVVPSGIDSGVAIGALAEQDDTRIGIVAESVKMALESIAKKWLYAYKNKVTYPRFIKYFGEDDTADIVVFKGNDLNSFDVMIESVNEISETVAQRKAFIVQLLNGGFFNDPDTGNISKEGRAKILEMLEMGDWENFDNTDTLQQDRAKRENAVMMKGGEVKIKNIDDDVVHMAEHIKMMLSIDYEKAISENPVIDRLANIHINEHMNSMAQKTTASLGAAQGSQEEQQRTNQNQKQNVQQRN
jgi:hypothetical protein